VSDGFSGKNRFLLITLNVSFLRYWMLNIGIFTIWKVEDSFILKSKTIYMFIYLTSSQILSISLFFWKFWNTIMVDLKKVTCKPFCSIFNRSLASLLSSEKSNVQQSISRKRQHHLVQNTYNHLLSRTLCIWALHFIHLSIFFNFH